MDYQVTLNNGQVLTVRQTADTASAFNAETFTQVLNNREITFVNIAGTILNKNLIGSIAPVATATQPTATSL